MQLFDVYPRLKVHPVRAKGCFVFDQKGQAYLDLYGGHAVISIGHGHSHYIQKVQDQLALMPYYSNAVEIEIQEMYAKLLGDISGCPDFKLFLCNSGAEANENALKLASFKTGKTKVIAFQGAFHGRTSAAVNVTDNRAIQAPINRLFQSEFHELNQIDSIESSLKKEDVCAIIIEGIQGINGIHVPHVSFLKNLSKLAENYDTPLILDEVQSGFGRSGQFFAFQHSGINPDLITVGKGMGNGFPMAGVLIGRSFESKAGLLGSTFGGNHLACAAGIAVLEVIRDENLVENAEKTGNYFKRQLIAFPQVREVRGQGLMLGIEFDFPVKPLQEKLLYQEHIFTGTSSDPHVLRLLPPLSLSTKEVNLFVEKLARVLKPVSTLI